MLLEAHTHIHTAGELIKLIAGMFSVSGFEHKITVQASPSVDKRKTQGSESTTPPASPGVIPRLRAIRCESGDKPTRVGDWV